MAHLDVVVAILRLSTETVSLLPKLFEGVKVAAVIKADGNLEGFEQVVHKDSTLVMVKDEGFVIIDQSISHQTSAGPKFELEHVPLNSIDLV